MNQAEQINKLWNEEFPQILNNRFGMLLEGINNYFHYIIEDENQNLIAWAVVFEKDNELRFSIIVTNSHKGSGLGSMLIKKLKEEYDEFYGWVIEHNNDIKINGENYKSPLQFYINHGFDILQDVRIDNEILKAVKIKWSSKNPNF